MFGTAWDFVQQVFLVAGGLGLFLYGMTVMSDGLEKLAGDKMRGVLERATSNRFFGILVGTVVTAVIQSSSATTVMVVGFVNASMMTLTQAIGVIMGANIGTTITAQIISFKLDPIAPLLIFVGFVATMAFKKRSVKDVGYIIMGFGILFFGISVMGAPLGSLSDAPAFQEILLTFTNPLLAMLTGAAFTAIIQSSSATTGIIVTLCLNGVGLPFKTAAFLVLGSNIGTCITATLASLTASRESKRAALSHVLFNTIGSIAFGCVILAFPGILEAIQGAWHDEARQIAMFHSLFNISTTALLVGFTKQLAWLVRKILPELPEESANSRRLVYLDPNIIRTPGIAVRQAHREMCRMGEIAVNNVRLALQAFFSVDTAKAEEVLEIEETCDFLAFNITAWLVRIRGLSLSERDLERLSRMLQTVSDMERISDHAENIAEYVLIVEQNHLAFSPEAIHELRAISELSTDLLGLSLEIFTTNEARDIAKVETLEQDVDDAAKAYVQNHIKRINAEICDPYSGVIFTDMLSDLERCGDHAHNIANSITSIAGITTG